MVFHNVACWNPYSILHMQLHFIPLYQNILAFIVISMQTQIYLSFSLEVASSAFSSIESCIKDIFSWMIGNKLPVNREKA